MRAIKKNRAKEYLQEAEKLQKRINLRISEIRSIRDMLTVITPNLSAEPSGGGSQDKLGNAVAKLVDLERELNEDVERLANERKEIISVIDSVENPDQLEILEQRYLQGRTLEAIACQKGMSYRTITYVHGKALQTVNTLMKERENGEGI